MDSIWSKTLLNSSSYPIFSTFVTLTEPHDGHLGASLAAAGPILITAFILYACLCSILRFRFEKSMRKRFNFPDRVSLARMTTAEAQEILESIITLEFPFMYQTALQFAVFKTYGIETISKTIVAAKSFSDPKSAPKRYEDTAIIFGEFSLNPPTSDRCIKAISRMNYLHSSYIKAGQISNADLLYTLSVSLLEPIRFMKLYEWRELNGMEIAALGTHWKSIGDAMHIKYKGFLFQETWKDGIEFVEDIMAWSKQYEAEAMLPAKINIGPSRALVDLLLNLVPKVFKPFAIEIITVLTGDRMREAFLYPEPSIFAAFVAYGALLARKLFLRYLMLPRMSPVVFFEPDQKSGRINHMDWLVEPWYIKPTFWNRWGPLALVTRALGGKRPGDEKYLPQGFASEDLGPVARMGKGKDITAEWEETLKRERHSGCPFSH